MNAYRVDIWCSVKNSGKWSHNSSRIVRIHARNEKEARQKVNLAPAKSWDKEAIEVSSETIYSVEKIGTVTIQPFYVYSNSGYSPVAVNDFKRLFCPTPVEKK